MGYFFRRSARLGPFRLNFSKSGVGASVGVKGARLTLTPRGTTYVTVGSHGFYYRETLSNHGQPRLPTPARPMVIPQVGASPDEIATADVSDLVDSSSEQLLQRLNERASMGNPAGILYCLAGLLMVCGLVFLGDNKSANTAVLLMLAALGIMTLGLVAHKKNTEKRTTRLFYELDDAEQQKHSIVQQALTQLAQSHRIWRIESKSAISDWKRNAGASSIVRRTPISVSNQQPPLIAANVHVPCVNMGRIRLFFLPDVVLCWQNGSYGSIAYPDFQVEQGVTRYIEDQAVPADATVVSRTWRYVNKNGGPDRRFNNNREIPVLQLGVLIFGSSKGLNIHLNTSSIQQSLAFANCWNALRQRTSGHQEERAPQHSPSQQWIETSSDPRVNARKILGVSNNASDAEISAAYRRLAQMYHPDKVAGLGPEFQALADRRMKEINAANEMLKARA